MLTWRTSEDCSYCYSTFNRSLYINRTLSKMQHWHQIAELQQRLWNWHCRGLCRLPAQVCASTKCFRERIKELRNLYGNRIRLFSIYKRIVLHHFVRREVPECLNIWLMGHHLLPDYSHWILWVKWHLWQFISFQLYSFLEWNYLDVNLLL